MPDSLGDLVDRLSIVNIKLYMVQDEVNFSADQGVGLKAETTKKLVALNRERTRLMNRLDTCLNESVRNGGAQIEERVKL